MSRFAVVECDWCRDKIREDVLELDGHGWLQDGNYNRHACSEECKRRLDIRIRLRRWAPADWGPMVLV